MGLSASTERTSDMAEQETSTEIMESNNVVDQENSDQICDDVKVTSDENKEIVSITELKKKCSNLDLFESDDEFHETIEAPNSETDTKSRSTELQDFKKMLAAKREIRRKIISSHANEMTNLKNQLESERKARESAISENKFLRNLLNENGIEISSPSDNLSDKDQCIAVEELKNSIASMQETSVFLKEQNNKLRLDLSEAYNTLQKANGDIASLHEENIQSMKHVKALKDVVAVSKTMLRIRENQLHELKEKLLQIEKTVSDREASLLSSDLRQEYERQLQNIRNLRGLYEERARLAEVARLNLLRELEEQKSTTADAEDKCKRLDGKIEELENKSEELTELLASKDDQINACLTENKSLKSDMATVNKLFSEMLFNRKGRYALDKLVSSLEEHHDLLTDMTEKEQCSEVSSLLPKMVLDLINQVDGGEGDCSDSEADEPRYSSAEEIVGKLPQVWRVLMELLSQQTSPADVAALAKDDESNGSSCYRSVDTAGGTRLVPSVSKTYIRLKDLIVEKMYLLKEMNKMKQLNTHLENRFQEQERRLCMVSSELTKTWHVVGRLKRHHQQLHTHEKILRYELQQKRKMLNELKEELEYCREKWDKAREKNNQSEIEWKKLRMEFSDRKIKSANSPINNSVESGYSDEKVSDDESNESNDECEINHTKSFIKKTVKIDIQPDSSTDLNLVAEGEDPISDMLDFTDLPLDGHGIDDSTDQLSDCDGNLADNEQEISISESVACDDINNPNELSINIDEQTVIPLNTCSTSNNLFEESDVDKIVINSVAGIFNETTSNVNEFIDMNDNLEMSNQLPSQSNIQFLEKTSCEPPINEDLRYVNECTKSEINYSQTTSPNTELKAFNSINPKKILESVQEQSERLAKREERMKRLEDQCKGLIKQVSNTNDTGNDLIKRLHFIQDSNSNSKLLKKTSTLDNSELCEREKAPIDHELRIQSSVSSNDIQYSEPSTSTTAMNHEAIFAARDERLKRLEEQTKSLVDKVNDTTNKGVVIGYKLDELHNIYGVDDNSHSTDSEPVSDAPENSQSLQSTSNDSTFVPSKETDDKVDDQISNS